MFTQVSGSGPLGPLVLFFEIDNNGLCAFIHAGLGRLWPLLGLEPTIFFFEKVRNYQVGEA